MVCSDKIIKIPQVKEKTSASSGRKTAIKIQPHP
jgi:hypothetical protein